MTTTKTTERGAAARVRRRLGMAAAGLAVVGATLGLAPTAALASPGQKCSLPTWGGSYLCDYGVRSSQITSSIQQVFVIGPDFAVWSRWRNGSTYSAWTSMGGQILHDYDPADWDRWNCGGGSVILNVVGTNGYWYYNQRGTGAGGRWSGWHQGYLVCT
jgi:hypothetical protein